MLAHSSASKKKKARAIPFYCGIYIYIYSVSVMYMYIYMCLSRFVCLLYVSIHTHVCTHTQKKTCVPRVYIYYKYNVRVLAKGTSRVVPSEF